MHDNTYNTTITKKLKEGSQKLIDHPEENNSMGDTSFTSHLEGMALRGENVVGGSGYVEATVRDMGFVEDKTEGTKGTGPAEEEAEAAQGARRRAGQSWRWASSRPIRAAIPHSRPHWSRTRPAPARSIRRRREPLTRTRPLHGPWEAAGR